MRYGVLVFTASLGAASPSVAQRAIDLSGPPARTLSEGFTHIAGVRALSANTVVVSDQIERRVFLVDLAADRHRQIGREGSGPGEYRFPMRPLAAPDGRTWMLDASLRRMLSLTPAGTFGPSVAAPYAAVRGGLISAMGTDRTGRIYFEGNSFDAESGRFTDSVQVVRWDPATDRAEVVGRVWSGGRVEVARAEGTASVARTSMPFPEVDAWAVLPDGRLAMVQQNPHRLHIVTPGRPQATVVATLRGTSVPITSAERNAYRAREEGARMVAAGRGGDARRRPPTADAEFPATMPAFIAASVIVSPDGEIWIGRSFRFDAPTRRYDVYDTTGAHTAVVTLRRHATVVGFGDGVVFVARTDPTDHLVYLESYPR